MAQLFAPVPATPSPQMQQRRGVVPAAPPVYEGPTAPKASVIAPIAYAQSQFKETGDMGQAIAQGFINSQVASEAQQQQLDGIESVAAELRSYPDLQRFVRNKVMEPADALRIASDRDAAVKKEGETTARRNEIGDLLRSDPDLSHLAPAWDSGAASEDQIWDQIWEALKPKEAPKPTDDQRELAQINEERKARGDEPLSMEQFLGSKSGQGFSVTTNPDGTVSVTQGGAPMKLTEQQSKDLVYYERGIRAAPTLDALENELTNLGPAVFGQTPVVGNFWKGEKYQQAEQAGREFLATILRKDTGAAVTTFEFDNYGKTFLPQPGDSPGVVAQKRASRANALEAIKAGLGTAQVLASSEAEVRAAYEAENGQQDATGGARQPSGRPAPAPKQRTLDGVTYTQDENGDWFVDG